MHGFLFLQSTLLVFLIGAQIIILLQPRMGDMESVAKASSTTISPTIIRSDTLDVDAYLRNYFSHKQPKKSMMVTASAYSSTPAQTDGTPHKTAYNTFVRDGIIATNFLPVGTVVRFPKKFGEKFFVVEDTMNERYSLHVDIWMADQKEAKNFGVQYVEMEIF